MPQLPYLLAPLVLGLFTGCKVEDGSPKEGSGPQNSGTRSSGEQLFKRHGCVSCHGANGKGGPLGPSLDALAAHWDVERLTTFLSNPGDFIKSDARLAAQARNYMMPMPPLRLREDDLRILAEYMLER